MQLCAFIISYLFTCKQRKNTYFVIDKQFEKVRRIKNVIITFQKAFSQVATSQMLNFCSSRSDRPRCSLRRLRRPTITFGKLPLGKMHIWEVATMETVTCKVALRKMSL